MQCQWMHYLKKRASFHNSFLTHWGWATHICVSKLTIIASDNGLSPGRRQAIIWNKARILSIGLLGTNFSEILIVILTFSFKKKRWKVSSAKWLPFCLGLYVLMYSGLVVPYGIVDLGKYWFGWWFVTCLVMSHYLNKCGHIINWVLGT